MNNRLARALIVNARANIVRDFSLRLTRGQSGIFQSV